IQFYFPAAAAATLLLLLVVVIIIGWYGVERIAMLAGRRWIARGGRGGVAGASAAVATLLFGATFALSVLAILGMALWSLADQWRYPAALPQAWSLANWMRRLDGLAEPAWLTLVVGACATAVALCLALACLENESHGQRRAGAAALWILYVPLLVPQ